MTENYHSRNLKANGKMSIVDSLPMDNMQRRHVRSSAFPPFGGEGVDSQLFFNELDDTEDTGSNIDIENDSSNTDDEDLFHLETNLKNTSEVQSIPRKPYLNVASTNILSSSMPNNFANGDSLEAYSGYHPTKTDSRNFDMEYMNTILPVIENRSNPCTFAVVGTESDPAPQSHIGSPPINISPRLSSSNQIDEDSMLNDRPSRKASIRDLLHRHL